MTKKTKLLFLLHFVSTRTNSWNEEKKRVELRIKMHVRGLEKKSKEGEREKKKKKEKETGERQ